MTLLAAAAAAAGTPAPPVAAQVPYTVKSPHGDRIDEYHWLRDDDPKAKRPEILRHLEAENAYTAAMMAPLQPLQAQLVAEMRARIQEDDSTPPVYDHGWWVLARIQGRRRIPGADAPARQPRAARCACAAPGAAGPAGAGRGQGLLPGRLDGGQPRRRGAGLDRGHRRPPHPHAALSQPAHRADLRRRDPRRARGPGLGQRQPHAVLHPAGPGDAAERAGLAPHAGHRRRRPT